MLNKILEQRKQEEEKRGKEQLKKEGQKWFENYRCLYFK